MLSSSDVTTTLIAVAVLLGVARLLGELAKRAELPAVIGEIVAGVLLGPTVFGSLAPELSARIFPVTGACPLVLSGFANVAIVLFMLVAGMEVDLSAVWRQGRPALLVSAGGALIPFGMGLALGWLAPSAMGARPNVHEHDFALFLAAALAISALPVIVRTMKDLGIFRTDLGMVVVAAAIVQDLAGWLVFSLVLGTVGAHVASVSVPVTLLLVLAYAVMMLSVGRWLLNRLLPWLLAFASWPGGILGFTATCALLCAAFTEWIGTHAVFGAFLFGVAIGDSRHMRERTRTTLEQFVSFVFAPLFFATIGLRVNFLRNFDVALVAILLVVAVTGKVLGATAGALLGAIPRREAWAIGVALSSRGAMEIIFGVLALQAQIIGERLFVALVVMALATSSLSGPVMRRLLQSRKQRRFVEYLSARTFVPVLDATSAPEAITRLSEVVSRTSGLDLARVEGAVLERERMMPTGLENGVAVPHARIEGLPAPIVAMGLCPRGLEFDTVDGTACSIVVLSLTPPENPDAQIEILADVARTFRHVEIRAAVGAATTYAELLAALRTVDDAASRGAAS